MLTVRFHPDAESEFREAITWYEHQRKGLGSEFVLSVDEAIERIRRTPKSFPNVHGEIRRAVVRRFPFAVFYELHSDVHILAVFHSKRNPIHWEKRI